MSVKQLALICILGFLTITITEGLPVVDIESDTPDVQVVNGEASLKPKVESKAPNGTSKVKPETPAGGNNVDADSKPTTGSANLSSILTTDERNDTLSSNTNKTTGFVNGIISFRDHLNIDTGAVKRTFYVVVALTGVVLIYFTVKGIRMKTKRKPRRYGLLAAEQELDPLDGDDEDEDMTLFEAKRQKKKGRK